MGELRKRLDTASAWHHTMTPLWRRYGAFGGYINTPESKQEWLPRGLREFPEDYAQRLFLTEDMGWTAPSIRRIAGTLAKQQATREYATSTLPASTRDQLSEFDESADGCGTTIDRWFSSTLPLALRFGMVGVEVVRDNVQDPISAQDEGLPYLSVWLPSEILWVEIDNRGAAIWVKTVRETTTQPDPNGDPVTHRIWRIMTRTEGYEYALKLGSDNGTEDDPVLANQWTHNLGVVPIVPFYATKLGPWRGWSYVHLISAGDKRLLQLESDQSMSSFKHGSPQLVIKTRRDLDEIAADANSFIKLNPEASEDAQYLSLDVTGMDARERVIERTSRQTLNAAGIDPSAVTSGEGGSARSGVSISYQFSTSEEPTLTDISAEMCSADRAIHEVVARYLSPGDQPSPHVMVFDGTITRSNKWDLMAVDNLVDLTDSLWPMIPSPSWRRTTAKVLAGRVPGGQEPEDMAAILGELDEADFEVQPPPGQPDIDQDGRSMRESENPDGDEDEETETP